ncbi:MAG: cadherin-like beta sandwich domain-containing protein [Eubacteriales bacterium]|nr:cadherin-like beta sandwich domain-containing protein [Eubacteriales bacterium]
MHKLSGLAKKISVFLIISIIGILVFPMLKAKAAGNASVSIGNVSGEAGSEVIVTISISSSVKTYGGEIYLSYNPEYIQVVDDGVEAVAGTITVFIESDFQNINKTFRVKIMKVGESAINFVNGKMPDENGEPIQVSGGSGTITGNAPVTYSTDNNLASLSISPGTLSPAFSPNVTTYTSSVGADCAQLVVSAKANDANATVSVSGTRMDPGNNTTTITVTAQSGDRKVYTIYTTKAEGENQTPAEEETKTQVQEQTVKISGKEYKIISDFEQHPLPSGYEAVDYGYNETTIKAGKGVNTKLILIYLESIDGNGKSGFYIYDSVAKSFTPYMEIAQPEITYVILPITDSMEKPVGLTLTDYNINGMEAKVMMSSDRSYCVFYGISSTGKTGWFRYDCKDKTIQSYVEPVNRTEEVSSQTVKPDTSAKMWRLISAGLTGAVLVLLIIVVILASKVSKSKKAFAAAMDDYSRSSGEDLDEDNLDTIMYNDEDEVVSEEEDYAAETEENDASEAEEIELFDIDEKK